MASILCVDDDSAVLELLRRALAAAGHDVTTAASAEEAFHSLERGTPIDLVISDFSMPDRSGLDLLESIRQSGFDVPVIILTGHATIEHAVQCLKAGAVDYLVKPFHNVQLEAVVEHALDVTRLRRENQELRQQVRILSLPHEIIGESAQLTRILDLVRAVAPTRTTILLLGESGTGKEVLARAIHDMSGRTGPFISINCAALPEALVESILFGHERGSFTGAIRQVKGAFERAAAGTLLLDEVSEMRPDLQAKLLRVLQEQSFERVGGNTLIRPDARILATSNRDLSADVRDGRFREDLYYRLAVVPIFVPPLRERPDDIPLLAVHFARTAARELGRRFRGLTPAALELLQGYLWPGNVRELSHAVERAVILAKAPVLDVHDFHLPGIPDSTAASPAVGTAEPGHSVLLRGLDLRAAERTLIEHALGLTEQNRTHAARLLGISVRTLRDKLNRRRP